LKDSRNPQHNLLQHLLQQRQDAADFAASLQSVLQQLQQWPHMHFFPRQSTAKVTSRRRYSTFSAVPLFVMMCGAVLWRSAACCAGVKSWEETQGSQNQVRMAWGVQGGSKTAKAARPNGAHT
jgi:hypothetical protein